MTQTLQASALYVVATPIGNREDMSPRGRAVLAAVDAVAAEDTRTSGALLAGYGIRTPLVSLHEHNERQRIPGLLARLARGEKLALVSDAGTPLISDPGFALVRAVREAGYAVLSVPGPCAAIAALSVCGLPTDRFVFAGFVAAREAARRRQFEALSRDPATLVFYVSKRQARAAIADACEVFGAGRPAALCRELTKLHETSLSGTLESLRRALPEQDLRGEMVFLIGGSADPAGDRDLEAVLDVLLARLSTKDAAAIAAELTGVPRREAYQAALARK